MYVYYGTNEYNFDVLENPPKYEPTKCAACGGVIRSADGGYSSSLEGLLVPRLYGCQAPQPLQVSPT